jgi:hypothetical protein
MTDDDSQRSWQFRQFRRSLQDLASAGSDQLALFPDRVAKPDELAWAFEHWATIVRGADESELSATQADAVAALQAKLKTMSRDGAEFGADLWTDSALRGSEQWLEVRTLATAALAAFGWQTGTAGEPE